jgi:hypothetical protein
LRISYIHLQIARAMDLPPNTCAGTHPPPQSIHILTFDAEYMRALTLAKLPPPPPRPDHLRRQFIAATTAPATLRFPKPVPAPYNREPLSHGVFEDAAAAQAAAAAAAAAAADDDAAPTFDNTSHPHTPTPLHPHSHAPAHPASTADLHEAPPTKGRRARARARGGGGEWGPTRARRGKAGAGVERAAGAAAGYVCRICMM